MTANLILFPRFRFECWDKADDANGTRYSLGLCADGVTRRPEGVFPTSKPLVSGTVLLDDHGRNFAVEPTIDRPEAMTHDEARFILSDAFEDMGKGSEYTDDLIWKPVDLDDFFAKRFYSPRWQQLTRVLLRCVASNQRHGT
jgi:hypothetical protein